MGKKKITRYDIVGQTIEEVLPYRDRAKIILSNGIELDTSSFDEGSFKEPEHPFMVKRIWEKQEKDWGMASERVKARLDSLVGNQYLFNKKPCKLLRVADYELNKVEIRYKGKKRIIDIYSLEDKK